MQCGPVSASSQGQRLFLRRDRVRKFLLQIGERNGVRGNAKTVPPFAFRVNFPLVKVRADGSTMKDKIRKKVMQCRRGEPMNEKKSHISSGALYGGEFKG